MTRKDELMALIGPFVKSQRSPQTAAAYAGTVRRFLRRMPDEGITITAAAGYKTYLETKGLRPGSLATKLSQVRSFVKFAQKYDLVAKGPLDVLTRPYVPSTTAGRVLYSDEVQQLVTAARGLGPKHTALVITLATTGCRISEIVGAKWSSIFEDAHGFRGLEVVGKRGKVRRIKLRDDAFEALADLHGKNVIDPSDKTPLFASPYGGSYTRQGLWQLFKRVVEAAQLSKTAASPHWMSFVDDENKADLLDTMQWLGHANPQTTLGYVEIARGVKRGLGDYVPSFE